MLAVIGAIGFLITRQASMLVWLISFALFTGLLLKYGQPGILAITALTLVGIVLCLGAIRPLRRALLSNAYLK